MLRSYLNCNYIVAIFAIRCPDPAGGRSPASGSRNHRTTLYCRQADSAAACFCGSAWLALVFHFMFRRDLQSAGTWVSNCAGLSSGTESQSPGGCEESPPWSSPQRVSGARQQIINLRQLAVDCKSASTCKSASAPLNGLFRCPINSSEEGGACAVTGCSVGFEIQ